MRNRLLESEFVKNGVVLEFDVEESHAGVTGESEIEAKVPPFHILLLIVHSETLSGRLNLNRRRKGVERQIWPSFVGDDPVASHIRGRLLDLALFPCCTELGGRRIVYVVVEPSDDAPARRISTCSIPFEEKALWRAVSAAASPKASRRSYLRLQCRGIEPVDLTPVGQPVDDPAVLVPAFGNVSSGKMGNKMGKPTIKDRSPLGVSQPRILVPTSSMKVVMPTRYPDQSASEKQI